MSNEHTWPGSSRHRNVRLAVVAVLAAGGLLLAACGGSSSNSAAGGGAGDGGSATTAPEGPPKDGGSVVIGVRAETTGWNPTTNEWAPYSAMVGSSFLEPLVRLDGDAQAQPWLATSWEPNADATSWTVKLRPNVTFHDGTAFNAEAVKRNLDNAVKAPVSSMALGGLFKEVVVVDDLTVRVDLTLKWAAFPTSFLSGQTALMMAPAMLAAEDGGNKHPIGTGPFAFDSWDYNNQLKVKKNTSYWRQGEPHLDAITFKVIPDPQTQRSAVKSGDAQAVLSMSADIANEMATDYRVIRDWDTEPAMLLTNTLREARGAANPLANQHARKALAYATDREAMAASVGEGVGSPTSPFGPDTPWGLPENENGYVNHDLDKARQEIDAYKADTGADALRVTVSGSNDVDSSKTLQLLQSQWKEAGIDLQVEALENSALIGKVILGDYQAALFPIYSSPDPDQNWYFWSSETAQGPGKISINFTQYSTPQMDADLLRGRESADFATRKQAYSNLVRQINEASTNIWLYWTPYSWIADPSLKGLGELEVTPFGNFQPKTWYGQLWLDQGA